MRWAVLMKKRVILLIINFVLIYTFSKFIYAYSRNLVDDLNYSLNNIEVMSQKVFELNRKIPLMFASGGLFAVYYKQENEINNYLSEVIIGAS